MIENVALVITKPYWGPLWKNGVASEPEAQVTTYGKERSEGRNVHVLESFPMLNGVNSASDWMTDTDR